MPPLSQVYCTDEDLYALLGDDYGKVCPDSQVNAQGHDGVFDATTPWVLTSPTIDFQTWKVHARQVVTLTQPRSAFSSSTYLAVDGVAPFALSLRRPGLALGDGQPPGLGGVIGVYFTVQTFDPQIRRAAYAANQRYGIDPNEPGRTPGDLHEDDWGDLREWTAQWVAEWAYRLATSSSNSSFDVKHRAAQNRFDALDQQIVIRWGTRGATAAASSSFGRAHR